MSTLRLLAAGVALAASLAAPHAAAAPVFANAVVSADSTGLTKNGASIAAARLNGNNALSAPDSAFYSLGFGGSITLSFGTLFGEGLVEVFEITNGVYPEEAAKVFALDEGIWKEIGTVTNVAGQNTLTISGVCLSGCSELKILDASNAALHANDADGFDLNAVSVTPFAAQMPAPATAALLGVGLLGVAGALRRRARG